MKLEMLKQITPEQALLILSGRLTFKKEEIAYIQKLVDSKDINWFEFFKLTFYHKTFTLCWKNIKCIYPTLYLPKYLEDIAMYTYRCTEIRNKQNEDVKNELINLCKQAGIMCIPVKGVYLINALYKNYGIRYSGDMDFLIRYEDIGCLKKIMKTMGYVNGKYKSSLGTIEPITRSEEVKWKMYMSNLYPYIKLSNNEIFPYFKMDFRYALDDKLDKDPIREIINDTIDRGHTLPIHFLIHLCTHFYDEAKHSASVAMAKDVNMIKLCDIREFILGFVSRQELVDLIAFAKKYGLQKAVYYTIYCINEIYGDGYENDILESLQIRDTDFLNTFGENTSKEERKFSGTFLERFLECGSKKDLDFVPKLFEKLD